jgi:hypothetical protein
MEPERHTSPKPVNSFLPYALNQQLKGQRINTEYVKGKGQKNERLNQERRQRERGTQDDVPSSAQPLWRREGAHNSN